MLRRCAILVFAAGAAAFGSVQQSALAGTDPDAVNSPDLAIRPAIMDPLAAPKKPAANPMPTGSPLWGIPLSTLSAIRERPLFSPSRRPPAPSIAGPAAPPKAELPSPQPPARPAFMFVGAITGDSEGFAIFIDKTNNTVVRLRTGQSRDGWTLISVKGREATLQNDQQTAVFALPAPTDAPPAAPPLAVMPGPVVPTPSGAATVPSSELVNPGPGQNFAPFVPLHMPKKGEPDGL